MINLSSKKCKPCEGGQDPLSKSEARNLQEHVPGWKISEDATVITCTFTFGDFQSAIVFVNKVAGIAEHEGHHPDIFIHGYRYVTISLTTHAINGLSENDFIIAAKVDELQ